MSLNMLENRGVIVAIVSAAILAPLTYWAFYGNPFSEEPTEMIGQLSESDVLSEISVASLQTETGTMQDSEAEVGNEPSSSPQTPPLEESLSRATQSPSPIPDAQNASAKGAAHDSSKSSSGSVRLSSDAVDSIDEDTDLDESTTEPGVVYVYRSKWEGIMEEESPVFLNGRLAVEIGHGTFVAFPCNPGKYTFSSEMERKSVSLSVGASETYCMNLYTGMLGKTGLQLMPLPECKQKLAGLSPHFLPGPVPISFE